MELKEFIKTFASLFEETDVEEIKAETKFRELDEWSSLLALSVIAMADEEYEVQLRGDDMRSAKTVEDLYNIIKSRTDV